MNKNYSQRCAIACEYIPWINREDFREQFIWKKEEELTEECKEFLELCCANDKEFIKELNKGKIPEKLKKFVKEDIKEL